MVIPSSLLGVLAALGVIALCCGLLWALPQAWHRLKYKRFMPSHEELELKHVKEMQELRVSHLRDDLVSEKTRTAGLSTQLQETIEKLVNKI